MKMKMKMWILFFLVFVQISSIAQMKRWIMGSACFNSGGTANVPALGLLKFYEMDFTSGSPVYSSRILGTSVTSLSTAGTNEGLNNGVDASGNLAFYVYVSCPSPYTSTTLDEMYFIAPDITTGKDEVFATISAVGGGGSSVRNIDVVPKDGTADEYYVIYKTACINSLANDFIRYVIVNTTTKTVTAPITLASVNYNEGLAVSPKNCLLNNRWLFFIKYVAGNLQVFRSSITASGISSPSLAAIVIIPGNVSNGQGDLEISPQGDKIAIADLATVGINHDVVILNLDLASGNLTSQRWINNPTNFIYSCEFSPDGQRLYMARSGTSAVGNELYNVAVPVSNYTIVASDVVAVALVPGLINLEVGYDGYLYFNKGNYNTDLCYITNPNANAATNIVNQTPINTFGVGNAVGISFPDQIDGFDTGGSVSPSISATSTILCSGASATLTASGGINYQWTTSSADTNSVLIVSPSVTTTYYVNVMSGSCSVIDSITIVVDTILNVIVSGVLDVCVGQSTTLAAIGATSYLWSGGASGTTPSIIVMPLTTTQYYLTSTSSCGTAIDTITVNVNPLPSVAASPNQTICLGQTATLTATGIGSYLWTGGILDTTASVIVTPLVTTNYFITTSNSCGNAVDSVLVSVIAAASVAFDYTFNTCTSAYSFNNNSVNSFSNLWYFGDSTQSNLASPVHVYGNGTYLVWLVINAGTDCADSISQNITVNNNNQLTPFIPNVFTPNNDGINDEFVINDISDCAQYHLTIYDRWGIKVFETKQLSVFWDGRKGKQNEIVEGIYFYILEISNTSSSTSFINGSVSITR